MKIYHFLKTLGLCALVASCALPALGSDSLSTTSAVKDSDFTAPFTTREQNIAFGEITTENPSLAIARDSELVTRRMISNRQKTQKFAAVKNNIALAVGLSAGLLLAGSYLTGRNIPLKEKAGITLALGSLLHWNRNEIFSDKFLENADIIRKKFQASAQQALGVAAKKGTIAAQQALGYATQKGKEGAIAAWNYAKQLAQSAKESAQNYLATEELAKEETND